MDPVAAKQLADAGGWAVAIMLVSLILVGGLRRWWVFGWLWTEERMRSAKLAEQLERNTDALAAMTRALDRLRESRRDRRGRPDAAA